MSSDLELDKQYHFQSEKYEGYYFQKKMILNVFSYLLGTGTIEGLRNKHHYYYRMVGMEGIGIGGIELVSF